jgi:3-oxoacyl-[acyl-carrier protein] reductase
MARWGRIDALVCNAGMTRDELLIRQSEAAWDHIMAVNLKGAFNCAQAVLDPMLKQQDGQIIMISSFAARAGRVGQAGYAAAKAGLIGLVLSLARELGSRNVRVNAVLPGVMRTGMTANLTESELAALGRLNLLGRLNSVEEVARVIALLASTRNISGQIFQLDSRIGRST